MYTTNVIYVNNPSQHHLYQQQQHHHLHHPFIPIQLLSGKERASLFLSKFIPNVGSQAFVELLPSIKPLIVYSSPSVEISSSHQMNPTSSNNDIEKSVSLLHSSSAAKEARTHVLSRKKSSTDVDASYVISKEFEDGLKINDKLPPSTGTSIGRKAACIPCAKSKVRCVRYDDNAVCERCLHGRYTCVFLDKRKKETILNENEN